MMSPNFGGEGNSMEQPQPRVIIQPEGRFVQDSNSGGLFVPESYARNKAAQSQSEPTNVGPESIIPFDPVPENESEKSKPVAETTAERAKVVAEDMIKLDDSPLLKSDLEEAFIEESAKEAATRGEDQDEAKKKARSWLNRAFAIAGMTFNEFKSANEGSSMDLFIKNFLVFDTEGRFGGTSASSLRESLGTDNDDIYLNEVLEKGGSETLIRFFSEVLNRTDIRDLSKIKNLVGDLNDRAELDREGLLKSMAVFLNQEKNENKDRKFGRILAVFDRLEGKSPEEILKYFNIDLSQEAAETSTAQVPPQVDGTSPDQNQAGAGSNGQTDEVPNAA